MTTLELLTVVIMKAVLETELVGFGTANRVALHVWLSLLPLVANPLFLPCFSVSYCIYLYDSLHLWNSLWQFFKEPDVQSSDDS